MDRLRRFLRHPLGWLLFQVVQLILGLWLFAYLTPNAAGRQGGMSWAIFFLIVAVLFGINLWIRRRFIPTGGPGDPIGPPDALDASHR